MKNIIIVAVVFVCFGCAEGNISKCNRTLSQVEVLADRHSKEIGEDGWFKRQRVDDIDAWGNKVELKYKRTGGHEILTVWSNGPDGLPFTKDDISSHSYSCANLEALAEIAKIKKIQSKDRQEALENYSFHLTKGLTKGVRQGWQER